MALTSDGMRLVALANLATGDPFVPFYEDAFAFARDGCRDRLGPHPVPGIRRGPHRRRQDPGGRRATPTQAMSDAGLRLRGGGTSLVLGVELARGGQGTIYSVREPAAKAVFKRYHAAVLQRSGSELADKIGLMIAAPPAEVGKLKHRPLAWPTDLVETGAGDFVGLTMPRINLHTTVELHRIVNPSDRNDDDPEHPWLRGFSDWRYLLTIAANLATVTAALHRSGYVVGDFNERNILVNSNALVTIVDCDSIQVPNGDGPPFLCAVGRPEFTAPELLDVDLRLSPRPPSSDNFALAIHVYQLLMEGRHPFDGVWHGGGDKPRRHELARLGLYANAGDPGCLPSPPRPDS